MWYNNLSGKGSDNLMDNVKDYLEKLEIKNSRLEKQLKEVQVSKVVYFKEDRIVICIYYQRKWYLIRY